MTIVEQERVVGSSEDTEYGKTENIWRRDDDTHKLIENDWRNPGHPQVGKWLATEKIDGQNGRIILDWGYDEEQDDWRPIMDVRGRSDAATLHKTLLPEAFGVEHAYELTGRAYSALKAITHCGETDEELDAALRVDPIRMVVYGEFYGPGIQKIGARYADKKSFRVFDVRTWVGMVENAHWSRPRWRTWEEVETVASVLGLSTVPVVSYGADVEALVEWVRGGLSSYTAAEDKNDGTVPAEGLVARTDPYLFDSYGHRVFFKLKAKDLA